MRFRDWDKNLKIRLYGEGLMNITFWMFFPFLTIYFSGEFGKTLTGILLVFSQAFAVIASLLGGYLADRFGRKRMMVLSAFGQGVSLIIFSVASSSFFHSAWVGFSAFAMAGFCNAIYWPASQAMVADVVGEKDRNSVFAVFYMAANLAVVVGPIIGAIFYHQYFSLLLLTCGIAAFLLVIALAKKTRETLPFKAKYNKRKEKPSSILLQQFKDYKVIVKDKVFFLYILAGILISQTYMQLDLLLPIYIKDTIDVQNLFSFRDWTLSVSGEQTFAIVLAENGLMVILFSILVTKWMARYREKTIFFLSSIVYAVSFVFVSQSSFVWGFIVSMAVFTFAELMTAGIMQGFIAKIAPEDMRGQYFAAASLRHTIGKTIAPLSIPLSVWIGYHWTFMVLSLLAVGSALLYRLMFVFYDKQTAVLKGSNRFKAW